MSRHQHYCGYVQLPHAFAHQKEAYGKSVGDLW
ncbi:hypothetical protein FHS45_000359 [Thalassobacillus devorans]|nr:hypothetical protein [Thalassobacillus devorans]